MGSFSAFFSWAKGQALKLLPAKKQDLDGDLKSWEPESGRSTSIQFLASMPYPEVSHASGGYEAAQRHSAEVDHWLGLNTDRIEKQLQERGCRERAPGASGDLQELWIGLATQRLLTPYTEIRQILKELAPQPGQRILDLGAGYGRMGFVIGRHYPQVHFVGYEFVGERVHEGRRCLERLHYPRVELKHADLSAPQFSPEPADFYFIYDYGNRKAVEKTLHDLRRIAKTRSITVIGRGRLCRDIIEKQHYWLTDINPPQNGPHYSVYRS